MKTAKTLLVASTILFAASTAHAALYYRGSGMVYDSDLNITWQKNPESNPQMTFAQATAWAANLSYGGYDDWRLPSAGIIGDASFSYDGSTDYSYNNTRSELGHLFLELGNNASHTTAGVAVPYGGWIYANIADPITHQNIHFSIENSSLWEADIYAPDVSKAWVFGPSGLQTATAATSYHFVWAVRDGDVAAVPVPAAAWLFGSGLMGLAGVARRYKVGKR